MKLSHLEVSAVFYALSQINGQPRRFHFAELAKINALSSKLDKCVKDNKIEPGDYELDFTNEEKLFVKKSIEENDWQTGDAKVVLGLTEKLK